MANRFLIIAVVTTISLISLTQCVNESVDHSKVKDPALATVNPNFNPNSTIAGNNSFISDSTDGHVYLLDSNFVKKQYYAVRGRCDCDTVSQCNYYIISGYFETTDSIPGKASFNAYFTKKPTVSMDYKIVQFLTDTTNKLVYTLDDASVFLKVTEIAKTHKTFGGVDGLLHVTVDNNLSSMSFSKIKGKNLSNISDTTFLEGNFKCIQ